MARADLLKQLFRAYKNSDREQFMEAARALIEEERRKHHTMLAQELTRILNNGVTIDSLSLAARFHPPPRDQERKTALLEIRRPSRYLRDLILDEVQLESLQRVMREFRQWDVLEANGLSPSHKVLFCGPPGCGKTAAAEALSSELGLPLLYVRFDSVVSSLLGETAANLRKVFEYAAQDNWVILFDEFDAIGRSRDDVTEHGEIKRVVNSFLQMLDNFQGRSLVVAATNFEQALDPALWRRFDEIIRFQRPTVAEIETFMRQRLRSILRSASSFSEAARALGGSSFADVERVCVDVLKTCVMEGRTAVQRGDLRSALQRHKLRHEILQQAMQVEAPRVDLP